MSLHAALKAWYSQPGDHSEAYVDNFVVDIVRNNQLIEIQTGNFSSIRHKLAKLTERHQVRLVHPIPQTKWIIRLGANGHTLISRRKSPKRGCVEHLFSELVSFPELVAHPNFSLEVLLTQEEEYWRNDGQGSWRRKKWSICDRRLIDVLENTVFTTPVDFQRLLPGTLPQKFTTRDLTLALEKPRSLAQKMAYCLRRMGVIEMVGKRGNTLLYSVCE